MYYKNTDLYIKKTISNKYLFVITKSSENIAYIFILKNIYPKRYVKFHFKCLNHKILTQTKNYSTKTINCAY